MLTEASGRFELLANADSVANRAADEILLRAAQAVAGRGRFRILLAGGSTPLAAYRLLRTRTADWSDWEVYFGDERCLPPDHPERNSLAARRALLDQVPIPPENIFAIPAELGAEQAAHEYAKTIAPALPFDLVLLGMGEDGHTASLFPSHPIPESELVIPVHDAPKPPPDRVSLTPRSLSSCREMLILVTGAGKREALAAWRGGAELPVARVAAAGSARVFVDADAAGS
ncbi:MAG: 6-phosphogluconolactonase [Pseudomonadota bacterium]|nr:6-phosphogluconolactonase [Pseudomonadota bacterium]